MDAVLYIGGKEFLHKVLFSTYTVQLNVENKIAAIALFHALCLWLSCTGPHWQAQKYRYPEVDLL